MRTCTVDGCQRKHCARELCKVHYNRMRGEKNPVTRTGCQRCGIEFEARNDELKRGKGKYCSPACYHAAHEPRHAKATALRTNWPACKVMIKECPQCARLFVARGRGRTRRMYCSDDCGLRSWFTPASPRSLACSVCATVFKRQGRGGGTRSGHVYCSRLCEKRSPTYKRNRAEMKRRRRARKRGATVEPVTLAYLLRRDRWTCGLCSRRIPRTAIHPHPKSPTVDHIVPLAEGGAHSKANCQAAHFICNSLKSAGGSQQLALIG